MGTKLPRVSPGDLISSQWMNQVLDQVDAMQQQIDSLQAQINALGQGAAAAAPIITGTQPPNQVHVLDDLFVFGNNFLSPPALNTMTINGVAVQRFYSDSTTSKLHVAVPFLPNTPVPANIILSTLGGLPPATWSNNLQILPLQQIPTGSLSISLTGVSPAGNLSGSSPFVYEFTITPGLTIPEAFNFTVTFTNAAGNVTWAASVLDSDKTTPLTNPVQIQTTQVKKIYAQFSIPTGGTTVNMNFVAQSLNNPSALNTSLLLPLTVGGGQPFNDPTMTIEPLTTAAFPQGDNAALIHIDANGNAVGSGGTPAVGLGFGKTGSVTLTIDVANAGNYKLDVGVSPSSTQWAVQNPNNTWTTGGASQNTVKFSLTLNATAGSTHTEQRLMTLTVTRTDVSVPITSMLWIPIVGM